MKIRERLQTYCEQNGLFPEQAQAVVEATIADIEKNADAGMQGRWDDSEDDYPKPLIAVLLMWLRRNAVTWIDANKPMHWARPLFADDPPAPDTTPPSTP